MSALAGLVRFDSFPADVSSVARMIDCVAHRGADWCDVWAHDAASFASDGGALVRISASTSATRRSTQRSSGRDGRPA